MSTLPTWTADDKPMLYVRDTNFNIIRLEEHYASLVWTERFQECGEFVLDIPLNAANFEVYKRGNYVMFEDSDESMIVESIEINEDFEQPTLEVSGRTLTSILERRVNASKAFDLNSGKIAYTGVFGTVVSQIVKDEITEPYTEHYEWWHKERIETDSGTRYEERPGRGDSGEFEWLKRVKDSTPYRIIPNFSYENSVSGVTVDKRYTEIKSVYDLMVNFAKKTITGFKVVFGENGNLIFKTYQGSNRTSKQAYRDPLIFSFDMDNVAYVKYFEDHSEYSNVALAYTTAEKDTNKIAQQVSESGQAADPDTITDESTYVWVANPNDTSPNPYISGLDRREFPVSTNASNDASSEASSEEGFTEKETSLAEQMEIAAEEEFETEDHDIVRTTEGSIDSLVRYKFGVDYFLGDTVEYYSPLGIHVTSLIDEVVRSYDQEGYIVTPNFKTMDDYDYGTDGDPDEDDTES